MNEVQVPGVHLKLTKNYQRTLIRLHRVMYTFYACTIIYTTLHGLTKKKLLV